MKPALVVSTAVLAELAPPQPAGAAHKGMRGRVLVIGGSSETPGAALLAGLAALRAGAGVLQIATTASVATALAVAIPEARVIGLTESAAGDIAGENRPRLVSLAAEADAVIVGPGLADDEAMAAFVPALLSGRDGIPVVVDAQALAAVTPQAARRRDGHLVLTPNSKEAADLLGMAPEDVEADPGPALALLVRRFRCTVALRGGATFVGQPGSPIYHSQSGTPGLGTSGSGDVLTGFLTGLLARGTPPLAAAVWAVHVHAHAGQRLRERVGRVGYLARELLDEMPVVAAALTP